MTICGTGSSWRYWRGTAKRLIRIDWIDIWGFQTIHRFGHQSGPDKRSGGPSTATFGLRHASFGMGPKTPKTQNTILKQVQAFTILKKKCAFPDISMYVHVCPTFLLHVCMFFNMYTYPVFV